MINGTENVIITGANSMIGIGLVEYLLQNNRYVTAVARTISDKLLSLKDKYNRLEIVNCNLANMKFLSGILRQNYDVFYHVAWMGVFGEERNRADIQCMNVTYTLDCVKLAKAIGCKTFVGIGSQAEYGAVDNIIDHNTIEQPYVAYGIAKLAANKMSRILANSLEMKSVWVRLFSVYGPGDNPNSMVMSSISKMLKNKDEIDYTLGTQLWNYLYIDDAIKGIVLAAENGKNGTSYNIASSDVRELREYIKELAIITNTKSKLNFGKIPYAGNKMISLNVDISEEISELGFIPSTTFEDGIKKVLDTML